MYSLSYDRQIGELLYFLKSISKTRELSCIVDISDIFENRRTLEERTELARKRGIKFSIGFDEKTQRIIFEDYR